MCRYPRPHLSFSKTMAACSCSWPPRCAAGLSSGTPADNSGRSVTFVPLVPVFLRRSALHFSARSTSSASTTGIDFTDDPSYRSCSNICFALLPFPPLRLGTRQVLCVLTYLLPCLTDLPQPVLTVCGSTDRAEAPTQFACPCMSGTSTRTARQAEDTDDWGVIHGTTRTNQHEAQ